MKDKNIWKLHVLQFLSYMLITNNLTYFRFHQKVNTYQKKRAILPMLLFNRILDSWKNKYLDIEIHPDTKPYHAKTFQMTG